MSQLEVWVEYGSEAVEKKVGQYPNYVYFFFPERLDSKVSRCIPSVLISKCRRVLSFPYSGDMTLLF